MYLVETLERSLNSYPIRSCCETKHCHVGYYCGTFPLRVEGWIHIRGNIITTPKQTPPYGEKILVLLIALVWPQGTTHLQEGMYLLKHCKKLHIWSRHCKNYAFVKVLQEVTYLLKHCKKLHICHSTVESYIFVKALQKLCICQSTARSQIFVKVLQEVQYLTKYCKK